MDALGREIRAINGKQEYYIRCVTGKQCSFAEICRLNYMVYLQQVECL